MTYIPTSERVKVIKKGIQKEYKNVSVRKGKGTACGWVEAGIKVDRPQDCVCEWSSFYWNGKEAPKPFRNAPYCEACKLAHNNASRRGEELANIAMKEAGYEHSTYYSDDGYNTERSEFLLQVNVN